MRRSVVTSFVALSLSLPLAACAATVEPQALGGPRSDVSEDTVERAQYGRSVDGQTVVAESRYGHGSVTGPVRRKPNGRLEVRAPGGTWFECVRSCTETLRRETVDFWENHGRNGSDGPGYVRFGR